MIQILKNKTVTFYKKFETRFEILFFVFGFIFDAILISEVDDIFGLVQQVLYLFAIGFMIYFEILYENKKWNPPQKIASTWQYRSLLLHFLLGTLLNLYSLFYIKSASLVGSLFFLMILIGIILANELPIVKKANVSLKVGLYAVCIFSFFAILFPLVLGFVGWTPFGLSVFATTLTIFFIFKMLQKRVLDQRALFKSLLAPATSVLTVFVIFYFMGWIPPVPISVVEQGIYHNIERKEGNYLLSTEKKNWKFWQAGDQDFLAEPDDRIFYYAQIYSPARFADEVFIQWSWWDPKKEKWQESDRIQLKIVGGRKKGFRGYAVKSNFQPGDWKIQLQTYHGQEISRLYFEVTAVEKKEDRVFNVLRR